jgi:YrbI family 3-deoxy-D-manno-octulosonate 8-phosphate phosphatase
LSALKNWAKKNVVDLADIAYVGNDINDLECLKAVGLSVIVADAHPSLADHAQLILMKRGGDGAIRELAEFICSQEG